MRSISITESLAWMKVTKQPPGTCRTLYVTLNVHIFSGHSASLVNRPADDSHLSMLKLDLVILKALLPVKQPEMIFFIMPLETTQNYAAVEIYYDHKTVTVIRNIPVLL